MPKAAPTELNAGNRTSGTPSSLPTDSWKAPNRVFDDVALPDRATAIQPRTGASST